MLALAGATASCGFRPLYAPAGTTSNPVAAEMAAVTVANIPERPGQLLRLALQARLGDAPGTARRYELSVGYGIAGEAIAIRSDSASTRERLVARAEWTLRAQDVAGTVLAHGVARTLDGFDQIDQQPFADDLANESAQRRLALAIADQIALQLAIFFAEQRAG